VAAGGFLEWASNFGHLYGTPVPEARPGQDVLLEIDVKGAEQVKTLDPSSELILLVPPSLEAQADRLRGRGDPPEAVAQRVAEGEVEVARARLIADHEVINDDLDRAVDELTGIIRTRRAC
jgi:guanylate kinase